jgi:GT2 family glycosyltransferase
MEDLEMVEGPLIRLLEKHKKLEMIFWGCCTEKLHRYHPRVKSYPSLENYADFVREFQKQDLDVAIAPLTEDPFNQGKSGIKWMEYAAGSIPGVFSPIPAYRKLVEEGRTGHVCRDEEEWFEKLDALISDRELRQEMGKRCRKQLLADHLVSRAGRQWEELIESIRAHPRYGMEGFLEKKPEVSIIIPVFNCADFTDRCLQALFNSSGENLSFEVIVVDNASSDHTAAVLEKWADRIRILRNAENLGFARANNQGAHLARADFLVMLNNDTEVKTGWLEALVRCQRQTGAALVGARLYYPNGHLQHGGVAIYQMDDKPHAIYTNMSSGMEGFERLTGRRRAFQIVTAACWLVRKNIWEKLEGFDEAFINGYEDVDFCLRLGELGEKVYYEPKAEIVHHESRSPGRSRHATHNEEILFSRWRGRWRHDHHHYLADDGLIFVDDKMRKNELYEANLQALYARNPKFAEKVFELRFGAFRLKATFQKERPSLVLHRKQGDFLISQSGEDLEKASKWAEEFLNKGNDVFKVIGFALGLHVRELLKILGEGRKIHLQVFSFLTFRLALENLDLQEILRDERLYFVKNLPLEEAEVLPPYQIILETLT